MLILSNLKDQFLYGKKEKIFLLKKEKEDFSTLK